MNEKMKIAVIAGASHALKYKQKHPNSTDHEALQFISQEMSKIIDNID
jgi:hypothetical protein